MSDSPPLSPSSPDPRPAGPALAIAGGREARRVSLGIALVLAVLPPLLWHLQGRQAMDDGLQLRLRIITERLQQTLATADAPADAPALAQRLIAGPALREAGPWRLLDPAGGLLAGPPATAPSSGPARSGNSQVLARRMPLVSGQGQVIAWVEHEAPLAPLWAGTALAAAAGLALGGLALAALTALRRRDQRHHARLVEEQARARVTLHAIVDAVITTDRQERIDYLNPTAEQLLRIRADEARGRPLQEVCPLVDELTLQPLPHPVTQALMARPTEPPPAGPAAVLRDDGATLAIEHRTAPIQDQHGHVIGAVMVFHDVTTVRRLAQRINWTATHDALTGLVNRRELEARIDGALLASRNSGLEHVLVCLDLDEFKLVNEGCGHAAGDSLLKQMASVLQSRLREADTLARLDGDSFGVLLEGCGLDAARRIANGLLDALHAHRFEWEGRSFAIGASIGLAPLDAASRGAAEVLAAAHGACLAAKEQGRDRICTGAEADASLSQRRSDLNWAARVRSALEQGRLRLWYQRYRALDAAAEASGPVHVEILLRLLDEDGRTVAPGVFMPAAERYNLMPAIDRWVIGQVFAHYRELARRIGRPAAAGDAPGLVVAVNLSGASLNGEGLLDAIRAEAHRHAIPPGAVCFEITESTAIHNLDKAAAFMTAVKALGFRFALDDFGIGSSSFGYLKKLPVDVLKIDGNFVRDIATDPVDRAMVETIHRVGHIMGLATVAEFAETPEALAALQSLGVDYAQGYGVHRPEPAPLPEPGPQAPAGEREAALVG